MFKPNHTVPRWQKGNILPIEFGAHQAILVANDEAKSSFPPELRLNYSPNHI